MVNLAQLTEEDFEKMAQEIDEINETNSEDDLLERIGNALHDSGLTVATGNNFEIIKPKMFNQNLEKFSMKASLDFVADTTPLTTEDAVEEGRRFVGRFKDKLKVVLCNDSKIRDLITGEGTLKDYLIAGVPLVVAALGLTALNPLLLAIVAAVFALIVKVGFQTYCEI